MPTRKLTPTEIPETIGVPWKGGLVLLYLQDEVRDGARRYAGGESPITAWIDWTLVTLDAAGPAYRETACDQAAARLFARRTEMPPVASPWLNDGTCIECGQREAHRAPDALGATACSWWGRRVHG